MNIFEIKCPDCGGFILGPREGGKARGRWLGYDKCTKCREVTKPSAKGKAHDHDPGRDS